MCTYPFQPSYVEIVALKKNMVFTVVRYFHAALSLWTRSMGSSFHSQVPIANKHGGRAGRRAAAASGAQTRGRLRAVAEQTTHGMRANGGRRRTAVVVWRKVARGGGPRALTSTARGPVRLVESHFQPGDRRAPDLRPPGDRRAPDLCPLLLQSTPGRFRAWQGTRLAGLGRDS